MSGMKTFITSSQGLIQLGFLIGLGMVMLSELKHNANITTTANTSIGEVMTGIGEYTGWIGLIVLIIVGAFLFKKMNFGGK
jgi:hypothetical protein